MRILFPPAPAPVAGSASLALATAGLICVTGVVLFMTMDGGKTGRRRGGGIAEIIVLLLLPVVCHWLVPVMTIITPPYTYAGAVLMLAGLALMIWAAKEFRSARTGFQLKTGGSAMVTTGPFRFSRNPMYLGMLAWLVGFAVLLGSLSCFFLPVLFFLVAQVFLIPVEEKRLEETFGEPYTMYRKQVRRWL